MKLYHGESWELMNRRWGKLVKDFLLPDGFYDISKVPDIYDCIKYDLQHNSKVLRFSDTEELHAITKAMADIVIPQVVVKSMVVLVVEIVIKMIMMMMNVIIRMITMMIIIWWGWSRIGNNMRWHGIGGWLCWAVVVMMEVLETELEMMMMILSNLWWEGKGWRKEVWLSWTWTLPRLISTTVWRCQKHFHPPGVRDNPRREAEHRAVHLQPSPEEDASWFSEEWGRRWTHKTRFQVVVMMMMVVVVMMMMTVIMMVLVMM